ncbi:hypothetical protein [Streptosporangium sp. NPDC003464]
MSGFTRDTQRYGDKLVYEAPGSKWRRYHDTHCRCGLNWVTEHAEPAGFTVVRSGTGWVALIGPGLTEKVDESALTTDALWEAVTGKPGLGWPESVRVIDRGRGTPQRSLSDRCSPPLPSGANVAPKLGPGRSTAPSRASPTTSSPVSAAAR